MKLQQNPVFDQVIIAMVVMATTHLQPETAATRGGGWRC